MNSLAASRLPAVPEDRPLNAAALHAPRAGQTREEPRRPAAKAPPPSRWATLLPTALAALALAVSVAAVAVSVVGSRREARGMEARLVDRLTAVPDERLSAMEASSGVRAPTRRQWKLRTDAPYTRTPVDHGHVRLCGAANAQGAWASITHTPPAGGPRAAAGSGRR